MEKNTFNLCEGRGGVARSRIWLEGERLVAAGFTKGKTFTKHYTPTTLVLELGKPMPNAMRGEFGTVSGSKSRPIIDIVGEMVRSTFGSKSTYTASFDAGRIIIRKGE